MYTSAINCNTEYNSDYLMELSKLITLFTTGRIRAECGTNVELATDTVKELIYILNQIPSSADLYEGELMTWGGGGPLKLTITFTQKLDRTVPFWDLIDHLDHQDINAHPCSWFQL